MIILVFKILVILVYSFGLQIKIFFLIKKKRYPLKLYPRYVINLDFLNWNYTHKINFERETVEFNAGLDTCFTKESIFSNQIMCDQSIISKIQYQSFFIHSQMDSYIR